MSLNDTEKGELSWGNAQFVQVSVKSHHPCPRSAPVGVSHILAFLGLPWG